MNWISKIRNPHPKAGFSQYDEDSIILNIFEEIKTTLSPKVKDIIEKR